MMAEGAYNAAVLLLLATFVLVSGQRVPRDEMDPAVYCVNRGTDEFFRKNLGAEGTENDYKKNCGTYYRCVSDSGARSAVSKEVCAFGLYFDVDLQTCQLKRKVNNCEFWEKFKEPKPFWPIPEGEENACPADQIQCGDTRCLPKELFCDGKADCDDGSDENICLPGLDPNGAEICDPAACAQQDGCYCSPEGINIPGNLKIDQTPQMITVTFSGAVNERNFGIFDEIFHNSVKNKGNECTAKATFFVSHAFTNYSAVQELHRRGHEIGVHSITNTDSPFYWSNLTREGYEAEMDGARIIIETYANITGNELLGMRVPLGRVGGNEQYGMMVDWGFLYDSSLAAPKSRWPVWPYTLHYRMPHKCLGVDQNCPSKPFEVWSMPLNELDRRDDPTFDEKLTGCHVVDSCGNLNEPDQFERFLDNNLAFHYSTNRAPFGLHFTAAFFETRPKFLSTFKNWVRTKAASGNYFFVTMQEAISWVLKPTEIAGINNFAEWKVKCDVQGVPLCSLPNPCPKRFPRVFPNEEHMYLYTCADCPNTYPWLDDPYGRGGDFLDDF